MTRYSHDLDGAPRAGRPTWRYFVAPSADADVG